MEYLGTEDMDGTQTYKLRVNEKGGDQLTYYIDTDSLMVIREVTKRILREARTDPRSRTLATTRRWRGSISRSRSLQSQPRPARSQTISFAKAEANAAADDALFQMPKSAK